MRRSHLVAYADEGVLTARGNEIAPWTVPFLTAVLLLAVFLMLCGVEPPPCDDPA